MNRARSLPYLVRWAARRFREFEYLADQLSPPFSSEESNRVRYIALEASNTWALLMRNYYLASATGAWLADGTRVHGPGIKRRVGRALTASVHVVNNRLRDRNGPWTHREEPNWVDPRIIRRLFSEHGLSNAAGFTRALARGTGASRRLITFRNFVAHRSRESAVRVRLMIRRLGIISAADPIELPFYRLPRRPVTAVTDWLIELRDIVELLPS